MSKPEPSKILNIPRYMHSLSYLNQHTQYWWGRLQDTATQYLGIVTYMCTSQYYSDYSLVIVTTIYHINIYKTAQAWQYAIIYWAYMIYRRANYFRG